MDLLEQVEAFLREPSPAPVDSLPELLRVRRALSLVYGELAREPQRAPQAAPIVDALWVEYVRLVRLVGEEALARAVQQPSEPAPAQKSVEPAPPADSDADADVAPSNGTPPATEQEIRAWTATHRVGERASSPNPSSILILHTLLDRVGRPQAGTDLENELDHLDEGLAEDALRDLRQLPADVQRAYLRMVTARLNAVAGSSDAGVLARERVRRLLALMRDYTKQYRPGAVHGLARAHEPKRGSWAADAAALWRELGGDADDSPPTSRRSTAASRRVRDDEGEPDEPSLRTPEPDWPLWPIVRGSSGLMVGGSPRESARERIERTFEMRELVWTADDPRKAQNAEARIAGFGLVLVLIRFVSHPTTEKLAAACAARGVPYVPIEHGYGVATIRHSLEHFLAHRAATAVAAT
jgi:hypothetical protein